MTTIVTHSVHACPECRAGKHMNCNELTWDDWVDGLVPCPCFEADPKAHTPQVGVCDRCGGVHVESAADAHPFLDEALGQRDRARDAVAALEAENADLRLVLAVYRQHFNIRYMTTAEVRAAVRRIDAADDDGEV